MCPRPISNGMEPTTASASGKIITALIVGLLVGFAAGVFWQDRRSANVEADTSAEAVATTTEEKMISKENEESASDTLTKEAAPATHIAVKNQPAGSSVALTDVDAAEVIWLAVREDKDGKLGNILGARKVPAGAGQTVAIELLRPTVVGSTYHVVVYRDIGTPDFNFHEDVLIEGMEGTFVAR